jgi:hypothetical protein
MNTGIARHEPNATFPGSAPLIHQIRKLQKTALLCENAKKKKDWPNLSLSLLSVREAVTVPLKVKREPKANPKAEPKPK